MSSKSTKTLFLSYSWADKLHADTLDTALTMLGIQVVRDVRDAPYKTSLPSFMARIRDTDFAILLLSNRYVSSVNCMSEVLEITKDKDFHDRVLPVTVDSPDFIYTPRGRLDVFNLWECKYAELERQVKQVDRQSGLSPIYEELKIIETIRINIVEFLTYLSRHVNITLAQLVDSNYSSLLAAIGIDHAEDLSRMMEILKVPDEEERLIQAEEFLIERPRSDKSNFLKAYLSQLQAQYRSALHYYDIAVQINPEFMQAHNNIGHVYAYHLHDPVRAEIAYLKAIEVAPSAREPIVNLAFLAHRALQDTSRAKGLLTRLLDGQPDNAVILTYLGIMSSSAGDLDSAKNYYREAIKAQPSLAAPYNNLAGLLPADEGVALLRDGLVCCGEDSDILARLAAYLMFDIKNHSEARELLIRSLTANPDNQSAIYNMGRMLRYEKSMYDVVRLQHGGLNTELEADDELARLLRELKQRKVQKSL